jgi:hypothetical protein
MCNRLLLFFINPVTWLCIGQALDEFFIIKFGVYPAAALVCPSFSPSVCPFQSVWSCHFTHAARLVSVQGTHSTKALSKSLELASIDFPSAMCSYKYYEISIT